MPADPSQTEVRAASAASLWVLRLAIALIGLMGVPLGAATGLSNSLGIPVLSTCVDDGWACEYDSCRRLSCYTGSKGRNGHQEIHSPGLSPVSTRQESTGKERDAETGLDYFLARYYSGAQGRFTSPDAPFAGQSPSNPQSWNMYAYALNNPLMITDPTGREPCANGINPLNGNICTEVVERVSSPEKAKAKQRAESGIGATKELYNMLFGLLNYTPAGLLYQHLAGKPGVEPVQPLNTDEYRGMLEVRIGSQLMLVGELTLPAEIQAASQAIAHGHAFQRHGGQFTRFGITNKQQFQGLVNEVIANAKGANVKNLTGGRSAYWDDAKGMVVIHDPSTPDKGTAFIPDRGRAYFDGLR